MFAWVFSQSSTCPCAADAHCTLPAKNPSRPVVAPAKNRVSCERQRCRTRPGRFCGDVHRCHWPVLSTAPQCDGVAQRFQVTHPFHPWHGRQFELTAYKTAWGEDRVYFYNEEQQLIALPASWTDVIAADPCVSVAEGRALFRADDLLELAALLARLSVKDGRDV